MTRDIRFPIFGEVVSARRRRGFLEDVLGGAVVLLAWILLWSFFAVAVVEPAARLHAGIGAPGAVTANEEL
jgi:hypothetical protein